MWLLSDDRKVAAVVNCAVLYDAVVGLATTDEMVVCRQPFAETDFVVCVD